jgi:hypothetical protein
VQGHRDVWYTLQQQILAIFNATGLLGVAAGNVWRFSVHRLQTSHALFAKLELHLTGGVERLDAAPRRIFDEQKNEEQENIVPRTHVFVPLTVHVDELAPLTSKSKT